MMMGRRTMLARCIGVGNTTAADPGDWQLDVGHYEAAKFALEIIAPRAGLTTANRYYKAYPGLLYRVPVAVIGGAWPFKYELVSAPPGMTIGETYGSTDYGIINWSNPVTSGSPHTVQVRVTDQQGAITNVTYTVTVTTSGFLFIDAINGNDANAGTWASPKQTINGWYIDRYDTAYSGYFVYYRSGTYRIDAADGGDTTWLACFQNRKPDIHLGYPGETAILDATTYGFCFSNSVAPTFCNLRGAGIGPAPGGQSNWVWWDAAPDALFFENDIAPNTGAGVSGTNPSIFMSRNIDGTSVANYCTIIGNNFRGLDNHMSFLGYDSAKGVFEKNIFSGPSSGNGCYLKNNCQNWSVRNNVGLDAGNTGNLVQVNSWGSMSTNIEVCFNNYRTSGAAILFAHTEAVGVVHDYRNTWQISRNVSENVVSGTWNSTRNVVRYLSGTQGYGTDSSGVVINRVDLLAATSGLIDTGSGELLPAYAANFGTHGHEVA